MIAFITEHKDHRVGDGLRWGVEPLCAVLTEHGIPISASTYYEWAGRRPSARALRDEQVTELIRAECSSSRLVAGLGSRKMWLRLRGQGHDVARCTVERLYRANGWEGARYGRKPRTTIPDERRPGRRTWSTATSTRPRRTGYGLRTSPTCRPGWAWSTSRSSSTRSPAG